MELLRYIWNDPTLRIITICLLILIVFTFAILFVIHLINTKRGKYSRFLWMESGEKENKNQGRKANKIKGKNINTGTNYGKIGDN